MIEFWNQFDGYKITRNPTDEELLAEAKRTLVE